MQPHWNGDYTPPEPPISTERAPNPRPYRNPSLHPRDRAFKCGYPAKWKAIAAVSGEVEGNRLARLAGNGGRGDWRVAALERLLALDGRMGTLVRRSAARAVVGIEQVVVSDGERAGAAGRGKNLRELRQWLRLEA